MITNWQRNIRIYRIDSVLNWFYIPIGVWFLIWSHYMTVMQIAAVYSIALFAGLLLELPTGAMADLIGKQKTVILGRMCSVLSYVIFLFADRFEWFAIAFVLYQVNWTLESGALSALMFDSLKENHQEDHYQQMEAKTFIYCTLGMAVASILGGFLYQWGIRWPYYAMIVVSIGSLIASLQYQEPHMLVEKFSVKNWIKQNKEGFTHIFRNADIFQVSIFSIIISFIGYTGLWYLYEPRLTVAGFDSRMLGWLVAGTYLIRALGTGLIGRMQKRFRNEKVPLFLVIVQMIGSGLSYVQGQLGAITSVYIRKFSDGFRVPILANMQNQRIESRYRATALSAISLLTNLLVAAVGPLIGWFNTKFGIPFTLGFFFWVGLVIALPLAMRMNRKVNLTQ